MEDLRRRILDVPPPAVDAGEANVRECERVVAERQVVVAECEKVVEALNVALSELKAKFDGAQLSGDEQINARMAILDARDTLADA